MQLSTLLLAGLALATGASADVVRTTTQCPIIGRCNSDGEWYTECCGVIEFNANDGCRNPKVLDINQVCMDWKNGRAHFKVPGKTTRCLQRQYPDFDVQPCGDSRLACSRQWWNEVKCTWNTG